MTEPKPAGTPSGPCRLVLAWIIAVVVIWSVAAIYGQVGKPDQNVELPQSSVLELGRIALSTYRRTRLLDGGNGTASVLLFPAFSGYSLPATRQQPRGARRNPAKPFLASVCIDVECPALVRDNFL
jgi:hypothetical protein